jgi:hypothetical protein
VQRLDVSYKREKRNPGITEIVEIKGVATP